LCDGCNTDSDNSSNNINIFIVPQGQLRAAFGVTAAARVWEILSHTHCCYVDVTACLQTVTEYVSI